MPNKTTPRGNNKNKALALFQASRLAEAKVLLEQLISTDRQDPDLWLMLGSIGGRQGQYAYAAECFRNAVSLQPDNIEAHIRLATALRFMLDNEAAAAVFRNVLEVQPENVEAGDGLAYLLFEMGRKEESAKVFRDTLKYHPEKAERHSAYGSVLQTLGLYEEAIAAYKKALQINPDLPVFTIMGTALLAQGRLEEAVRHYREAVTRQPDSANAHSGLVMSLNYLPDIGKEAIYREHLAWGEIHGCPNNRISNHSNIMDIDRRLRVGYVSPDFRANHSVTYFMEPILAGHDRKLFEVFCYSVMPQPDETTKRFKRLADHWRDIHQWDDGHLVKQFSKDKIDILVDLAGHSAHNSLTALARKPAPIQVAYLGYPNTTGVPAVDYRLTDVIADPAGEGAFYTEKLIRLPGCFLCYCPPADAPPVNPLPALQADYVTFASFNNLAKVNADVVCLWSRVLRNVPGSRLIIKNQSLDDPGTREHYFEMFTSNGIERDRIELHGHINSREEHLALYGKVDIALDTFPYNGTTTTCEALWMGVPVLSMAGESHAGRVGASLLRSVGLECWLTYTSEEFVSTIKQQSSDLQGLSELRARLRKMVADSLLCDRKSFVRNIESAYRGMWLHWCEGGMSNK